MKNRNYIDFSLFSFFLLIAIISIVWQFKRDFFFINETIALIVLTGSIVVKYLKWNKLQYVLICFLFICLFSFLDYSYTIENANESTTYHTAKFNGLLSPIVLFILVIYFIVHRTFIISLLKTIFRGSDTEHEEKRIKTIKFYREKFDAYSSDELKKVLDMYNDYPSEAQIALKQISKNRNF